MDLYLAGGCMPISVELAALTSLDSVFFGGEDMYDTPIAMIRAAPPRRTLSDRSVHGVSIGRKALPVLFDKVPATAAGWWRLLASKATDVAVAANGGLLPDLEPAKWGRSEAGPDAGTDHAEGCSVHRHVVD
jgi:hypothetical protein